MPTTPRGIWSPSDSDDWDLTVDWAAQSVSIDDAITDAVSEAVAAVPANYKIGTDAQRVALTGGDLYEGLRFRTTDTNREWIYDGGWLSFDGGLYRIEPTSVVGGTVSNGVFTVSSTTTPAVNGVFSSRFKSYRIVISLASGSASGTNFRLRAGGTDNAASAYEFARTWNATTSTVASAVATSTAVSFNAIPGTKQYTVVDIMNPGTAETTQGISQNTSTGGTVGSLCSGGFTHSVASAFDGFSLTLASAASGTIQVYGVA